MSGHDSKKSNTHPTRLEAIQRLLQTDLNEPLQLSVLRRALEPVLAHPENAAKILLEIEPAITHQILKGAVIKIGEPSKVQRPPSGPR